jgi:hypothetical protein
MENQLAVISHQSIDWEEHLSEDVIQTQEGYGCFNILPVQKVESIRSLQSRDDKKRHFQPMGLFFIVIGLLSIVI